MSGVASVAMRSELVGLGWAPARPLPPRHEMERAFRSRDRSYDGIFCVGVRTTGVFCLPSCAARKPLMEHVEFYADAASAVSAGYRPCRRCHPMDGAAPAWIGTLVAACEEVPARSLTHEDLRALGIEPSRARRAFLRAFGLTFHAYCRGRRLARALDVLRRGGGIDDAVFESGYDSHSGFRDSFMKTFGHPPGHARGLETVQLAWIDTPVGRMVAGATGEGVCLLEFCDRRVLGREMADLGRRLNRPCLPGETDLLRRLKVELEEYFAGTRTSFTVPTERVGSLFERRVWEALLRIPYGEVRSYEEIARRVGHPHAARAVGRANGRNRIAIVVPCHRVVAKSGDVAGYGGGVWRKRFLLHLERTRGH